MSGQTSIIGSNSVDIRTEKNTHIEGAVIAAENGNLKLDTGTLTYKDLQDKDTGSNTQVGVSVPLGPALWADASPAKPTTPKADAAKTDSSPVTDSLMGSTLSGSYDSHDKRQVNRATIGEGTIIIRTDPAQGLAGLNRDLQKAQELTKDSKTSVTVYVDPAAIKEVAGGFEDIQDSYEKIAELVKKALPGAAKSIDCKLNYYEKLTKAGHSPEDAQKIVQELGSLVTLDYDLTALADKFGGFDKIPVGEQAALLDKARTPTDVQLAFNGEGAGVTINSDALAKSQWLVYIGMLDRVSEASGAFTLLVHDYICAKAYLLGDTSKKAEYNRYNKTIDDSLAAIKNYISHPVDGLTNTYSNWTAQLDAIVRAQNSGDAGTTMRLLGGLMYDVQTTVAVAQATGSGAFTLADSGLAKFVGGGLSVGVRDALFSELKANGIKFSPESVLRIEKLADGRVVWLESGNASAGLAHILKHADDFLGKGITATQIPDAIMTAVREGKIIGYQGKGIGRPIYEFTFNGKTQRVAITVSGNGYIVGANPTKGN